MFSGVLASLRSAEQELERQLAGIKRAISSLEFGGSPAPIGIGRSRRGRPAFKPNAGSRKRRKALRQGQGRDFAGAEEAVGEAEGGKVARNLMS